MSEAPLLIYGGTFDPVHRGHRACAAQALGLFEGSTLHLIPCGDPPHREPPRASAEHRARMLELAFADLTHVLVDRREMRRDAPSYTIDTLRELRAEFGSVRPVVLVLGIDAAAGLSGWHESEALAGLSHLLVVQRPGVDFASPFEQLGWEEAVSPLELTGPAAGKFWLVQAAVSTASSTAVRAALAEGECSPTELDPAVAHYIVQHRLYADSRA